MHITPWPTFPSPCSTFTSLKRVTLMKRVPIFGISLLAAVIAVAQAPVGNEAYQAWKETQALPVTAPAHPQVHPQHSGHLANSFRDNDDCACWVMPDSTYTTINNDTAWNASGWGNGDDGSFGPVTLPFSFMFYGQAYNQVYININGSISFGNYVSTYSASSFPMTGPAMIAPFWGDVDLRGDSAGANIVQYKVTPTALILNWTNVGYYTQHTDKVNSFQVIISDGTDPAIPGGNNVSFCYGGMHWTTGDASGGTGGFGGAPATVGANMGDGLNYLQLGRFDHDSTDWDGPYDSADGVAWLSDRHFSFSTASEDVPPIYTSIGCDTLEIEAGTSMDYPMMIIAGGPGQVVTASSQCLGIAGYSEIANTSGDMAYIMSQIAPTESEVGIHTINYAASNDGTLPLTSTYTIYVKVLASTVGMGESVARESLSIRPNPATDKVSLTWPDGQQPVLVQVIAADGSIVQSRKPLPGAMQMEINVQSLAAGLYTVRAISDSGISVVKLLRAAER